MAEIKVQYYGLEDYIRALKNLADRLKERNFITTELLNESEGQMCMALNETNRILCEAEQNLRRLVLETAKWLETAQMSFLQTEQKTVQNIDETLRG